ncbi:type I polyketide synthase [Streptomyces mayteni]
MAIRNEVLPASLHIDEPSPHVDWSTGAVSLLTRAQPWQAGDQPRRAGISSFGISGTNAHVIVEEAPESAASEDPVPDAELTAVPGTVPWTLSARSSEALRAQAGRLLDTLSGGPEAGETSLADVGHALATTRTTFPHRAVVLGETQDALRRSLRTLAEGGASPDVVLGSVADAAGGRTAFLFTGQGSQRPGMGRGLYEAFPVYAEAFDTACAHCDPHLERRLRDVVFAAPHTPEATLLDQTRYAQPGLFAVETALFRLFESFGVRPDIVMGHSVGELVAAHVAGVLSLEDACLLVAARGRLMQSAPAGGAMVSVRAPVNEVREALADVAERVAIAAVNGPASTVMSGDAEAVREVAGRLRAAGRKTKRLRTSHAFHSPHMDDVLGAFREVAAGLGYAAPRIPVVSNVTGGPATAEQLASPDYWAEHIRATVLYQQGVTALEAAGATSFVEVGPDAVLSSMARECLAAEPPVLAPALRGDRDDERTFVSALAALWTAGKDLAWTELLARRGGRRAVALPTYAFQRQTYWLAAPETSAGQQPTGQGRDDALWAAIEAGDVAALARELRLSSPQAEAMRQLLPALGGWRRQGSWSHRLDWTRLPGAGLRAAPSGTWLLVVPADRAADPLVAGVDAALTRHGARVVTVAAEQGDIERSGLLARLKDADAGGREVGGVLSLLGLAVDGVERAVTALAQSVALVQALRDMGVRAPLWWLSHGGTAVGPAERPTDGQAMLWGLGRAATAERPEPDGGLVDLPAEPDDRVLEHLVRFLARPVARPVERQVAIRAGGVYGLRLRRTPPPAFRDEVPASGPVLVAGRLTPYVAHAMRQCVAEGCGLLLLAVPAEERDEEAVRVLEAELAAFGATVNVVDGDPASRDRLAATLDQLASDGPLSVLYSPPLPGDRLLAGWDAADTADTARAVSAAVAEATALGELTRGRDVARFWLFSSFAAAVGAPGRGGAAALHAVCEALSRRFRAEGLPATVVAWGPQAVEPPGPDADEVLPGTRPMDPGRAAGLLSRIALDDARTCALVETGDADTMLALAFAHTPYGALLAELPEVRPLLNGDDGRAGLPGAGDGPAELQRRLDGLGAGEQEELLLDLVCSAAAEVLGHETPDEIDSSLTFLEIGFTSFTGLELRNILCGATGLQLPAVVVFEHPSPSSLVGYLRDELMAQRDRG